MTEHRPPSAPDATAEGPGPTGPRQLPGPGLAPRPPNPARMRRAAIAAAVVLALAALLGSGALGRLRQWVHDQPAYAWSPDRIILDPEPPDWIGPGPSALIEGARREGLDRFDGASLLDLDKSAVERAFKKLPWVEEVAQVELVHPNRVRVRLRYRRPVARVVIRGQAPGAGRDVTYYLDEHAVILPGRDLEPSAVPELIDLFGPARPYDSNPGRTWNRPNPSGDGGEPDPVAIDAARLAGFLLRKQAEQGWPATESGRPFRLVLIAPAPEPTAEPRFYVLAEPGTWIFWDEPPGAESPGQPSADRKWEILRDWVARNDPRPHHEEDRLYFTRQGIRWKRNRPEAPPS